MATAGSGDVLTGFISSLVAQGYDALTASIFGVYLHGKSGDLALDKASYESLTASHLIDFFGEAIIDLFKQPEQQNPESDDDNKHEG